MAHHKYHDEEMDAQTDIKAAGFNIALKIPGQRAGGPDYSPVFSDTISIDLYALDVTDNADFRRGTTVENYHKLFMVSTEGLGSTRPALGQTVHAGEQVLTIIELRQLAPAYVPLYYIFVLE